MSAQVLATSLIDVGSLFKVLVASILAGAGLVAVFAIGITGLSAYAGGAPAAGSAGSGAAPATGRRQPLGLVVAIVSFAVVLAGVAYGLYVMLNK